MWSPGGGVEPPEGDGLYGSPPGRSFCAYKRNQNTLGAVPQDPLDAKLRLDTNDALASSVRRRRYALKVPAAHFYVKFLQTDSRKSFCRAYGLNKQLLGQTAPPPQRGRGQGVRSRSPPVADAARRSTRSGRKNRASEQREDFFGHRKAVGANAAAGYLWSASVRSADLDFSTEKNLNP